MKQKLLLAFIIGSLAITAIGYSTPGGDAGNGGGGDEKENHSWIPVGGMGQLFDQAETSPYPFQLSSFAQENPEISIRRCSKKRSNSDLAYPEFPTAFQEKIIFKTVVEPGRISRFFGGESKVEPLTHQHLCSSEKRLTAYGTLAMTLLSTLKKDMVGTHLLVKTMQKGPITFVVSENRKTIPAKGGEIEEFSWFDHTTGEIYWSNRNAQKGFITFVGRQLHSFLRHELAHLLIYRSLAHYPRPDYWHDISEETKGDPENHIFVRHGVDPSQPNKDRYNHFKTSAEAAFIEGLAFALERGTYMEHPMILENSDMLNQLYFDTENQNYYYTDENGFTIQDEKFIAPLESEVYLASTIHKLFFGFQSNDSKSIESDQQYTFYIVHTTNNETMRQVIDIISTDGPSDVISFAKSLDQHMGSDIGYRWLREFYFYDYKTGLNTFPEFQMTQEQSAWDNRFITRATISKNKKDSFFTPYVEEEEEEARQKSQEEFSKSFDNTLITHKIDEAISDSDAHLQNTQEKIMTFAKAIEQRNGLSEQLKPYIPVSEENRKARWDLAEKLYNEIEKKYYTTIYLMLIQDYLNPLLDLFTPRFQEREAIKLRLENIKNTPSQAGGTNHRERVINMLSETKALVENEKKLIELLILTEVVKDHFSEH
ncbi:MAG: hypothetical protein A3G92_03120 [Deltaproteobacteria bacterium RIFCSPLOWO2_12_FULL_38_8]|nr:MAG: hypothetical protein A3G92_03120 [Deltaproteobacteria bacterium RIFCSPLOWO2_12_FULL_38_8]